MVKYEVNIRINQAFAESYFLWLKAHVDEMLLIEGFLKAEVMVECLNDDSDIKAFTILYDLKDIKAYENYIEQHAPKMRSKAKNFEGQFTATRRVFEILK